MSLKASSTTMAFSSVLKKSTHKHVQKAFFSTGLRLENEKPKIKRLPSFAQIKAVQLDQYIEEISMFFFSLTSCLFNQQSCSIELKVLTL